MLNYPNMVKATVKASVDRSLEMSGCMERFFVFNPRVL